ncbi:unnamed protein product [Effrenium voratum]|uniref:Ion transport domain-containing protein n=1 Tax=Effrenium voratum TaxID=2562239 RepID=A0AA36HY68_9DINO|nr:unnamed protein product [Effrenium voratum]CAJ1377546.1 unnamed protein product [Effrenium voratum]CAJ1421611.1 unnamed protein product [Effrenium voratum]
MMFDLPVEVAAVTDAMSIAIFCYWLLDVPATFLTGYDSGGILEMRFRVVARNYLKGWLSVDVTILMLDILIFVVLGLNPATTEADSSLPSFRLARALRLMRFLRLLRLHKMANLAADLLDRVKTDSFMLTVNILRSLSAVLALNHYVACAFLGLALMAEGQITWLDIAGLSGVDFWTKYLSSLHWSLTQFMPATNNIAPNTAQERVFAILIVLIGLAVFSSFVSTVTNTVNQLRRMHMEHFNQETRMKSFLTQKCVSVDVWCRVQRFCRLRIVLDKKSLKEADIPMLKDLPSSLRVKLHQEIYMPALMSASWMSVELAELDEQLTLLLCDKVFSEKVASALQEVFLNGHECNEVVIPGGPLVYRSSRLDEVVKVDQGAWLCELCLWAHWEHRGQLDAREVVHYIVINGAGFASLLSKHGGPLFHRIRTIGLLYIALAEARHEDGRDQLTDLPLPYGQAQDVTGRAMQFSNMQPGHVRHGQTVAGLGSMLGGV